MTPEAKVQLLLAGLTFPLIVALMINDVRHRKLPNKLNVTLVLVSLIVHTITSGFAGLTTSVLGLFIGFGLLLPFYLFHLLGAGDVKFLAALGAMLGTGGILIAAAAGVLLAGLGSFISLLCMRRELASQRWALIAAKMSSFKMLTSEFASYDSLAETRKSVPYSVYLGTAAMGTLIFHMWTLG